MVRHSGNALERAQTAYEAGEMEEALDDLERYLGLNPQDDDQIVQLALWRSEWHEKGGDIMPLAVRDSLTKAVDADADNLDLRREAAKFDMKIGLWQDAVAAWERIIEIEGDGGSIESRVNLAESYYHSELTGRDQKVLDLLKPMIGMQLDDTFKEEAATAPEQAKAYSLVANLYLERRGEQEKADEIMQLVVDRNPNLAEAFLARSEYLSSTQPRSTDAESRQARREAAIAAGNKAYQLDSESADVIEQVATLKTDQGLLKEAEAILRKGLEQYPENVRLYLILAENLARQDTPDAGPEAGLEVIKQGLLELPDNIELVNKKFTLEIQSGDADEAELTLEVLKRLNMPAELRQFYSGEVAFVKQEWAKAASIYEEVRPLMERFHRQFSGTIDQRLWVCYEVLSLPDMQVSTMRRMRLNYNSPELLRREALALTRMGRYDLAETQLDTLMNLESFDELPNAKLVQDQAIRLKTERMMRRPEEQRDWSEVDALLDELAPADSDSAPLLLFRYQMLRTREEIEAAMAVLESALELAPESEQVWMAKARAVAQEESPEAALAVIDEYEAEYGETPTTRGTRATFFTMIGGEDVQEKLLALETGAENWDENQQSVLWEQLAGAHMRVNSWRQALDLYNRIAEAQPQSLPVRMKMFEVAFSAGDEAAMVNTLGMIEDLVGRGDSNWKLQEARRQLWLYRNEQGGSDALDRAQRLTDQVHNMRPLWHVNSRVQADLALMENQSDAAILYLTEALENGPRDLGVLQKLVELFIQENRIAEARRWLNQLGHAELNDPLRRLQLVLDAADKDQRDTEALLARMDELVPIDTEDASVILFRARMLTSLEDFESAEQAYRRAVELAPASTTPWLQLVSFLVQQGRMEDAEQVANEAQMSLSETEVPLAMGQMYMMLGNYPWAEMYYKMAYEANPESTSAQRTIAGFYLAANRIDQATPYLNQILQSIDPESEIDSADVKWARREVAKVFAARGSYQDYLTAVKLIEENAPEGESLEDVDLMLITTLALSRPETDSRREAIERIELRQKQPEPTPDQLLLNLAKLYYRTNDVTTSRSLTSELARRYPENQEVVAFYINILWDQEDLAELNRWIDQLDKESYAFIELQALILAERDQLDRAVALIKEGLYPKGYDISEYNTDEELALYRAGTQLFARLGAYDEAHLDTAEMLLRQYVAKNEAYKLTLAAFLGNRGGKENVAEAFQILEDERGNTVATIRVTQAAIGILRANQDTIPPESPYYDKVDEWFEIGERESPDNRSLVIQRAGFEEFRGDFDAAIALYRRSLNLGELDFRQEALVNNNMAYLMALQGDDCDEPLELVRSSIALVGPISTLLDTEAMSYLSCNQSQQAISKMNQALRDGPVPVYLYHLALAHDMAENEGLAQEKLREALEEGLDPYILLRPEQRRFQQLMDKYGLDLSDFEDVDR